MAKFQKDRSSTLAPMTFSSSSFFQVYKTQFERVSEGWTSKIGDFERVNMNLQVEVATLQLENQDLKLKV